jgi:hypothetical protein
VNDVRIAYLILAHKNHEQVARLIARLNDPDASFHVHLDARTADSVYSQLRASSKCLSNVRFTGRYRCYWGGFGIVRGTLACIESALSGPRFDYAFLLSGQDYPIKPLGYLRSFLEQHRGVEFLEAFSLDKINRWTKAEGRYQPMQRVSRFTLNIRSRTLTLPLKRTLPDNLEPFGGSQWWCLSFDCLSYVREFIKQRPRIVRFCRHVLIPDEIMFHTIIGNSPFGERISGHDLTYTDWVQPNPSCPRVLCDGSDLESLMNCPKLFARKFDSTRDPRILDKIDHLIFPN